MNARTTEGLFSLEQLQAVSAEMLALAESGDWDTVAITDKKRLQILQNLHLKHDGSEVSHARKQITEEILSIDTKIKELASNERKMLMDKEIRQQAQVAAQASYKQALTSDTRF